MGCAAVPSVVRDAVKGRFERRESYREFLAAEAERAISQAQAEADVAARTARAVAEAQMQLLDELDSLNRPEPGPREHAFAQMEAETRGELAHALADIAMGARELIAEPPMLTIVDASSQPSSQPSSQVWVPEPESPAEPAVREISASGLTVRLFEDIPASTARPQELSARFGAHTLPSSRQIFEPESADDLYALEEEIRFRHAPDFPVAAVIEPQSIPGNLIEFPRELVAPRRARPRLAEGPLREEAGEPQLRIFEVDAIQMASEPEIIDAQSIPGWQGMLLESATVEEVLPTLEMEAQISLAPQTASLERRLMSAAMDACLVGAAWLGAVAAVAEVSGSALRSLTVPILAGTALGSLGLFAVLYQVLFFHARRQYARHALGAHRAVHLWRPQSHAPRHAPPHRVHAARCLPAGDWSRLGVDGQRPHGLARPHEPHVPARLLTRSLLFSAVAFLSVLPEGNLLLHLLFLLSFPKGICLDSNSKCNISCKGEGCMAKGYQHLSMEERSLIQTQLSMGWRPAAIAAGLQRARSTITREMRRNGWRPSAPGPRRGRPPLAGGYYAPFAEVRARRLRRKPRVARKLVPGTALWDRVLTHLRRRLSPAQIARTLARMPDPVRLSHETIYNALYAMPRGQLRSRVLSLLRRARKQRRGRAVTRKLPALSNMTLIDHRPAEVGLRLVPGHWEGDLIQGRLNQSRVGTLVERSTLFVLLVQLDDGRAETCANAFARVLNRVDAQMRLSLTYDQGREMAHHHSLAQQTGLHIYFAHPHSPWERGINENTNGLLRQYLPKGQDLSRFNQNQLDDIAFELNARPRKSLGWKAPAELFLPEGAFNFVQFWSATIPVALET